MGYGFGDTSAATENALILNGRIHKLAQVDFAYDSSNFKRPWKMTAPDGRLDLEFVPFVERVAKTDLHGLEQRSTSDVWPLSRDGDGGRWRESSGWMAWSGLRKSITPNGEADSRSTA